ncbi:MAG: copper resistance protein [Frankiales bacterium]|jgi:putative copper export protein|nr:copper resistance protein [Frankiales bacterium]
MAALKAGSVRRGGGRLIATAATAAAVLLLIAAPASAHEHPGPAVSRGFPLLASVGLYLLVLLAGSLAGPALTRTALSSPARRRGVSALAVAYIGVTLAEAMRHEVATAAAAGVIVAVVVGLAALLTGEAREQAAAAVVLVGAQLPVIGTGAGTNHLLFSAVHLGAAAVWAGGLVHLVLVVTTAGRDAAVQTVRRFAPAAIGSGVILAATGLLLMVVHRVGLAVLTNTTYGHVLLLKTAGVALAVGCAIVMRRRARDRARTWHYFLRAEAIVLATVVGFAVVLTGLPTPARAATQLTAGLAHIRLGDEGATVALAGAGARGLLTYVASDVDAPDVRIINRIDGSQWRPGIGPVATSIALAGGVARLRVLWSGHRADLTVRAAPAPKPVDPLVADDAGRASYSLGVAVARWAGTRRGGTGCVTSPDANALGTAFGTSFLRLGIRSVDVYVDNTARSTDLATGVRSAGVAVHVHPTSIETLPAERSTAALVATGVVTARRLIVRFGAAAPGRGVYLAPWLTDSRVLGLTQKTALPLLAIGSALDLSSPAGERYRLALATVAARAIPSAAGLLGYLSVADPASTARAQFQLFAAAPIAFLPKVLASGHDHDSASAWFPNGSLTAITAAAPVVAGCINP